MDQRFLTNLVSILFDVGHLYRIRSIYLFFYRKEIQKINGATEVFGLQHQFMEQSATSCKKFELYHKFQEKPQNTFILGGI